MTIHEIVEYLVERNVQREKAEVYAAVSVALREKGYVTSGVEPGLTLYHTWYIIRLRTDSAVALMYDLLDLGSFEEAARKLGFWMEKENDQS